PVLHAGAVCQLPPRDRRRRHFRVRPGMLPPVRRSRCARRMRVLLARFLRSLLPRVALSRRSPPLFSGPRSQRDDARARDRTQGPENCSFTEYSALLEQTRGCRSKANTFSLQPLERIQLGAQGSMEIFGPDQLFARGYFSFARLLQCLARILGELVRLGDPRRRDGRCIVCGGKLAARCFGRVEQVRPLALQPCATL